ncbi:MAG: pyridoxal-phosphate dependent enzyme, partial [Acidimicrobiia bacterium]
IETEQTPTLYASRAAGEIVDVDVGGVAVSSLGSKRLGDIAWEITQRYVEDSLLVNDESVREAQSAHWSTTRLIVEPGAAVGMASLLSGVYQPRSDETVVVLLSGANVDPALVVS